MNSPRAAPLLLAAAILLGIAALFFLRPADEKRSGPVASPVPVAGRPATPASAPLAPAKPEAALEGVSHLADELNAPGGTVRRDLEIMNEVFGAWQTNFPTAGNPVGENADITAALTGRNVLHFAFVDPHHPAINAQGELCDRWGTPLHFHQLGGTLMEIRSAGPDQKFGTDDDAVFTPASAFPVIR